MTADSQLRIPLRRGEVQSAYGFIKHAMVSEAPLCDGVYTLAKLLRDAAFMAHAIAADAAVSMLHFRRQQFCVCCSLTSAAQVEQECRFGHEYPCCRSRCQYVTASNVRLYYYPRSKMLLDGFTSPKLNLTAAL